MNLTNYSAVKEAVENRGLIDRISKTQGDQNMMPLGGTRLSQNNINIIINWKINGYQE